MKKKVTVFEAAMKYPQLVISFVALPMVLGIFGLLNMPRDEYPQFTIRQGLVIGVYPGATSKEVEQQLTSVVENYIFGYAEVNKKETYSYSQEGQMIVFVELNEDVQDPDEFWSKLRHGLEELKMQLPADVLALIGTNDFGDTSAMLVTMSSPQKDYRELETEMKKLETQIRNVDSVSKLKVVGKQKQKIEVYIDPRKLNEYKINAATILGVFKSHDLTRYSGKIDNNDLVLPVHLPRGFTSEADLEQLIVYSDPLGNTVRLKDVARVERIFEKPDSLIKNNGYPALILSLEMQAGKNIVHFGRDVEAVLNAYRQLADKDIQINVISNQPHVVSESINHFMKELAIAIISVIIVTMLLLPFRVAAVAAITIPVSVTITMGIMYVIGMQLDMVSLAGLIVVLGMVVDNAIVVIDNHVEKIDSGISPWTAAHTAAAELFTPVLLATLAISAAFFPLLAFMTGIVNDFVGWFPITIGIALGISMLVAMFLVPLLCYVFIKKGLHQDDTQNSAFSVLNMLQRGFDAGLNIAFKVPYLTIAVGILSVLLAGYLFMGAKQQLFPMMERNQFAVEVYLPPGASVSKTERVVEDIERKLLKDGRVTNVASFVGTSSPRFHALYAPRLPSSNYGQIIVNTTSNQATNQVLDKFESKYSNHYPEAEIKWKQLAVEKFRAPIEVRLQGDDIRELKTVADDISTAARRNSKTAWVRTDWDNMKPSVSLDLNRDKTNRLGYAETFISGSLMAALDGLPLTTVWEGDYPVDVVLTRDSSFKDEVQDLENQFVGSPLTMHTLPLRSIAELDAEWTENKIVRRNGVRTVTVSVDVKRGYTYSEVFSELKGSFEKIHHSLPKGISMEYGGEQEQMRINYIPMGYALAACIVIIFLIMLVQFRTISKVLVIMSTMLLSLLGAVAGLLITGYPFSLTAFIGVIGLMGITVRNGIILVDYAEQLVFNDGKSIKDAALAAGKRRMRPIFLTSMAAAVGVVPMIISQSPLWAPLGTVICFGLINGMVFTLFILPVLYWRSEKGTSKTPKKNLTSSPAQS